MAAAMASGFGCPPDTADVPFSGRTDRSIARDLFHAHGIEDCDASWDRFRQHYLSNLDTFLHQCSGRVLPGVQPLLELLAQRDGVLIGLLTGNIPEGAERKLRHFGLWHYFRFGAYGHACFDRDDVAHEASRQWCAFLPNDSNPQHVWVVGDTPHDIRCARSIGAKSLAVATGRFSHSQLAACRPDLVVETLDDVRGSVVGGRE